MSEWSGKPNLLKRRAPRDRALRLSDYTFAQTGWEEVADYALQWATKNARDPVTLVDVEAAFRPQMPDAKRAGIGHNVAQEDPQAFAKAVIDVDGY